MITDDELKQIMPNCAAPKRTAYLPFIQQAMQEFEITSYLRDAAFLAQLAHESAELRFMEEIASGAAYEGRKDLGNTQPGDGKRYKGRGPIQLTGRANYQKFGELLGLDLVNNPTIAATPEVGFRVAGLFWKSHGLNELADQEQFEKITRRINGGLNGQADRVMYYERAKKVLSKDDNAAAAAAGASAAGGAADLSTQNSTGQAPAYPGSPLRPGSAGATVRAVQQRLSELGQTITVDGNFGPGTKTAVATFQGSKGLSADGVVGPATWAALFAS
jgi:predicted chitinase